MQSVDEMRNPSLKQMNRKYSHLLEKHSSVYLPAVEKHAKELEKLSALEKKLNEDENAFKAMQDSKQSIIAVHISDSILLFAISNFYKEYSYTLWPISLCRSPLRRRSYY